MSATAHRSEANSCYFVDYRHRSTPGVGLNGLHGGKQHSRAALSRVRGGMVEKSQSGTSSDASGSVNASQRYCVNGEYKIIVVKHARWNSEEKQQCDDAILWILVGRSCRI